MSGTSCSCFAGVGFGRGAALAAMLAVCACNDGTSTSPGSLFGSVSGLHARGLVLTNAGNTLAVPSGSANVTFGRIITAQSAYAVSVQTQPDGETCTVTNGSGIANYANVTFAVTCGAIPHTTYALGGTISGLSGAGLVLSDGSGTVAVAAGAASFTFGAVLTSTAPYSVTVHSVPAGETCTVAGGSGTAQAAAVSNVVVTCSLVAASLGGSVSGLNGAGLILSNGSSTVSVAVNATQFTLPAPVAYGSSYAVAVTTLPAGIACAVTNGTGTMPASAVTNVAVTCTDQPFSVGGAIAGLTTAGLVLANGIETFSFAANASAFTIPTKVAYASHYAVTVETQPVGLACTVNSGSGTMPAANISNVAVVCAARNYQLEGSISGLTASGLVLADGSDTLTVAAHASGFTMPISVAYGAQYALTIRTQPVGLTCTVSGGSGTMPSNDVTAIAVTCANGAYTLGGTITGLSAGGLILANGTDRLAVAANAAQFTLPTPVVTTSSYALTIARQPSGMTCTASGGTGTMPPGNYAGIAVSCAAREWAWMSGPNGNNVTGTYGTQGAPAAGNDPGSRSSAVSWVDLSGNLWLYGGYTYVGPNDARTLDDLWEYSQSSGQWTWMGGAANADNVTPVYGTQGAPGPTNEPGSRQNSTVWTDTAGNFWLFGGNGATGYNDLWKYSPTSHLWTWMSGSTSGNAPGVFGVQGTPASVNVPGARGQAVSWRDAAGNLWLFGGVSFSGSGILNDLWRFSPASGLWTWMSGPNTLNATGVFGVQGTPDALNMPGARTNGVTWADGAGNFWLFGGQGYASSGGLGDLNDFWKYDTASGQWTWMGGSNTINASGTYGTQGSAAAGNVPPPRNGAVSWTDGSGTLWLFGGQAGVGGNQELNDLWQYSPNANQWTWVRGASTMDAVSVYGTQGTSAPGNMPGASTYMIAWADPTGTFWLFGGNQLNTLLNTLWSY